jgi:hypothetical protein
MVDTICPSMDKRFAEWEEPPVHPAAAGAPMMSHAELEALAGDIEAHGLNEPIVLWRDNTAEAKGSTGPFPLYLLDGRNRLAALKLLGITNPHDAKAGSLVETKVRTLKAMKKVTYGFGTSRAKTKWVPDCDPHIFFRSANVLRRPPMDRAEVEQLRARVAELERELAAVRAAPALGPADARRVAEAALEGRREAIRRLLMEPRLTVREIARRVGCSPQTVINVRDHK